MSEKPTIVWTSQYQLEEAIKTGVGFIYGQKADPEKADIALMRLADGGPASCDDLMRYRLIGNLLDRWEMTPNDLKSEMREHGCGKQLDELNASMSGRAQ